MIEKGPFLQYRIKYSVNTELQPVNHYTVSENDTQIVMNK